MKNIVIIGGGVAGSALAIGLRQAGRETVLIERHKAPADKVCGEFLSYEAVQYLAALGIDLYALGAVPIDTLRLSKAQRNITIPLPFPALSLSRRILDEALLRRAESMGAAIQRGLRVQAVLKAAEGWQIVKEDKEMLAAEHVFLATGKHELSGRKRMLFIKNPQLAFKIHYQLSLAESAALDRHVELFLFQGGYAGVAKVGDNLANLCMVVSEKRFKETGQCFTHLLSIIKAECPLLAERLAGTVPCWPKPLAIASLPYGFLRKKSDGIWYLGDQAAVIPSLVGEGMALALHSAYLAKESFLAGKNASQFQAHFATSIQKPMYIARLLSTCLLTEQRQDWVMQLLHLFPALAIKAARWTRVPYQADGMLLF